MSSDTPANANMFKLILVYSATVVVAGLVAYGLLNIFWQLTSDGFPVFIFLYIIPMAGAMTAAKNYVKDSGRKASFGYSFLFGLITAALVVGLVFGLLELGLLDGMLYQIDAYSMNNGERMKVYIPTLVITGGLVLFTNVVIFWAATIGEVKRMRKLAEKEAARKA